MKQYTPQEIHRLFKAHVPLVKSYYEKYNKVPLHLEDSKWKWDNHDYARIPCLLDFREWVQKYNLHANKLFYTSNDDPEVMYLPTTQKLCFEYEMDTNKNDLHLLNLEQKDFDFAIISQTLEHLYDPELCLNNIKNHLLSGGYVFASVPIINIAHMTPIHFRSITQIGLITLFDSLDFEILGLGQWGNKQYLNYIFEKQWWPDYRNLIDRHGIISNEFQNAAQTWILARKK